MGGVKHTIGLGPGTLYINGVDCGEISNVTVTRDVTTWDRRPDQPDSNDPDYRLDREREVVFRYIVDREALEEFLDEETVWHYSPARVIRSVEEVWG